MNLNKLFALSLLTCSLALTGCSKTDEPVEPTQTPSATEVVEVPAHNADMMSKYSNLTSNDKFLDTTFNTLMASFDEPNTSRLVFIGSPGCPHCQDAVVEIQRLAIDFDVDINYVCADDLSDKQYKVLKEKLDPILLDQDGEKDIFLPHLFAIKEGSISDVNSKVGFTLGETEEIYFEIFTNFTN